MLSLISSEFSIRILKRKLHSETQIAPLHCEAQVYIFDLFGVDLLRLNTAALCRVYLIALLLNYILRFTIHSKLRKAGYNFILNLK